MDNKIKFFPWYQIAFLTNSGEIQIPKNMDRETFGDMAIEIDISKNEMSKFGQASVRIYNLNDEHRGWLFRQPYFTSQRNLETTVSRVYLNLGYETGTSVLTFIGNIDRASSVRVGSSIATDIFAYEQAYLMQNSYYQFALDGSSDLNGVLKYLESKVLTQKVFDVQESTARNITSDNFEYYYYSTAVRFRNISSSKEVIKFKNFTFDESLSDILDKIALRFRVNWTTNGNEIVFFNAGDVISSEEKIIISAETGLTSTPRFSGDRISLSMLFEPKISVDRLVSVESLVQKELNGDYAVAGYSHKLTLGNGIKNSAITELNLIRNNV